MNRRGVVVSVVPMTNIIKVLQFLRFRTETDMDWADDDYAAEVATAAEQILQAGETLRAIEALRISVSKDDKTEAARATLQRIANERTV